MQSAVFRWACEEVANLGLHLFDEMEMGRLRNDRDSASTLRWFVGMIAPGQRQMACELRAAYQEIVDFGLYISDEMEMGRYPNYPNSPTTLRVFIGILSTIKIFS
jgi:hypothetical protein